MASWDSSKFWCCSGREPEETRNRSESGASKTSRIINQPGRGHSRCSSLVQTGDSGLSCQPLALQPDVSRCQVTLSADTCGAVAAAAALWAENLISSSNSPAAP